MKFLAIDTANEYLSVVAYNDGKIARAFLPDCSMRHSTQIMAQVENALAESGMTLPECDFFAAVVGAGSFTGIRIGISAVKGFCLATGKPALPITSFEVAAYNAVDARAGGKILCLVDALHDCYYACGFDGEKTTYPPAYLTEAEVLALREEDYALRACDELPIAQKAAVERTDPAKGLENAAIALSEKGKFGALDALYIRKSSAELNAGR